MHTVVDNDCPAVFKTVTMHHFIDYPSHFPRWLVPYHLAVDSRTNRTANPVFFAFETVKTAFVKQMRTRQTNYVIV